MTCYTRVGPATDVEKFFEICLLQRTSLTSRGLSIDVVLGGKLVLWGEKM